MMIRKPKFVPGIVGILLMVSAAVVQAQHLRLLIYKTDWDADKHLPCCISGIDWSEREQQLYFVSDQKDKVYRAPVAIKGDETEGYKLMIDTPKNFSLRGICEDCNLEAIRLSDDGTLFLSAERGDQHLESFLWKGKVTDDKVTLTEQALPEFFQGKTFSRNAGIEGISLSADKTGLWIINEGAFAGEPRGSLSLTLQNFKGGEEVHSYKLDDDHRENGVSEILCLDQTRLLALERHYSVTQETVLGGIFLITIEGQQAIRKKLLALDQLPMSHIDNYEGMCFGPRLKNGNRTLIVISDNNQDWQKCRGQQTDVLVFEIEK